jgi:hypothetical protein
VIEMNEYYPPYFRNRLNPKMNMANLNHPSFPGHCDVCGDTKTMRIYILPSLVVCHACLIDDDNEFPDFDTGVNE